MRNACELSLTTLTAQPDVSPTLRYPADGGFLRGEEVCSLFGLGGRGVVGSCAALAALAAAWLALAGWAVARGGRQGVREVDGSVS